MSVLKKDAHSAEAMGLSLHEARRCYDAWREHPTWLSQVLARRAEVRHRGTFATATRYIAANRPKWAAFCGQVGDNIFSPKSYYFVQSGRKMGKQAAAIANAPLRDDASEAVRQSRFLEWCRLVGYLAYKVEAPGMVGIPDTQVIDWSGRIAFVEFKIPGEEPKPIQQHIIDELTRRGHLAFWATDPQEAFWRVMNFFVKGRDEHEVRTPRLPQKGDSVPHRAQPRGTVPRSRVRKNRRGS